MKNYRNVERVNKDKEGLVVLRRVVIVKKRTFSTSTPLISLFTVWAKEFTQHFMAQLFALVSRFVITNHG